MKPNISETSYGYALTDELINRQNMTINSAPIFPTLYQEGQNGGGYDLLLDRPGLPLFLQFKLSDYLSRSNASEMNTFNNPYYRMYITKRNHSNQHQMLHELELNNDLNEVFYTAPLFHEPEELNDAYLNGNVSNRSLWINPSQIGLLPDDEQHYVVFDSPTNWYMCSEPKKMDFIVTFEKMNDDLKHNLQTNGNKFTREYVNDLSYYIEEISQTKIDISQGVKNHAKQALENSHPIQKISFYSRVFLNSEFYVVG